MPTRSSLARWPSSQREATDHEGSADHWGFGGGWCSSVGSRMTSRSARRVALPLGDTVSPLRYGHCMSLTRLLDDRRSPVREWFEDRLPNLKPFQAAWRQAGTPTIPAREGANPGTVGTAFDYRLRYLFTVSDPDHLVAAGGATMVRSRSEMPSDDEIRSDVETQVRLRHRWKRVVDFVRSEVDRLDPVGRFLDAGDEDQLDRICWVLALFEERARTGAFYGSALDTLPDDAGPAELLALTPHPGAADLAELIAGVQQTGLAERIGAPVVANPRFAGSTLVGGADADLLVDDCLVELKTTKRLVCRREDIYQLLGYVLLDFDDEHKITDVGFYLSRVPAFFTWPVASAFELAAERTVALHELRSEFRSLIDF